MASSRYIALAFALCGCAQIAGLDDDAAALSPGTKQGSSTSTGLCARLEVSEPNVDIGEVKLRGAVVGTAPITLRNTGDREVEVTPVLTGAPTFQLITPEPFRLGPNEQHVVRVSYTPLTLGRQETRLDFSTSGSTCDWTKPITISGIGSEESVLLSPSTVDFGDVACGATPPARKVAITSELDAPMQFDVTVGLPLFKLDPPSQLVAPKMVMPITITAGAAPKDSLAPVEDVLTARAGSVSRVARVLMQPKGVVLTFQPKTVDVEVAFSRTVTVKNEGNAKGTVTIESTTSKFSITGGKVDLEPGQSRTFQVSYVDSKSGSTTPVVKVDGAALCKRDPLVFEGKVASNGGGGGGPGGDGWGGGD